LEIEVMRVKSGAAGDPNVFYIQDNGKGASGCSFMKNTKSN
jgi:hypothetical protein